MKERKAATSTAAQEKNFVIEKGVLVSYKGRAKAVTVPSPVTDIGDEAFWGCDSLSSISLPASLTSLGDEAFSWCESLSSISPSLQV
jgi:hypothetical protein